jgi:hypothetical protein
MMERGYLLASMLSCALLFSIGCVELPDMDDDEMDDETAQLSKNYIGTLTLTYTKTFPAFTASTSMNVDVAKSGLITVGSASPASWDADEVKKIDDGQIRQTDSGSLSVTHGSSVTIVRGTDEYVALDVHVTITGEQETFAWDEEHMTWFSMAKVPYTVEDPMSPPLEFDVALSTTPQTGTVLTATAEQAFGSTVTYTWNLMLIPGLG